MNWLMRWFFWQPSQFIYSARRVVFAAGEVSEYDTSKVVSHAKRAKRRTA